jgi:hypothetical protein
VKYLSFGFTQQLHNTLPIGSINTMESTLDRDVLLKQHSLAEVELLHDPLEAGEPLPELGISSSQYAESIRSEPPKETSKDLAITPSTVPTNLKAVLPSLPTTNKTRATSDYGGTPLASSIDTSTLSTQGDALNPDSALSIPSTAPQLGFPLNEVLRNIPEPKLTKAEKKKIKSLQDRCTSLEQKLEKKERDLKATQHERNKARKETKEAEAKLAETYVQHAKVMKETKAALETEFHGRYEKLSQSKGTNEELERIKLNMEKLQEIMGQRRDKNEGLRLTVHTLKEEHQVRERELDEEVERLRSKLAKAIERIETELLPEIKRLEGKDGECEKLWRKLENKPRITQDENISPHHDHNQLMEKIKALERDLKNSKLEKESMKPLLDVGIAVRLRFLEQAKNTYLNEQRGGLNQITIREGNQAAHSANGTADAALFTMEILKNEDALAPAFERVYANRTPTRHLQLPELLRRAWDCFATLSLFKGVRSGKGSKLFRKEHSSLSNDIFRKWDRRRASDYPGKFERDIRNWYLLDRLEWLTVEIVEFDRLKSGGRLTPLVSSQSI